MEQRRHYRTLVLSDIHLGTSHSKTEEVSHFLSHVDCDRLILNGDIIDGWHLKKGGTRKWQPRHTRFFKVLMKMMERQGTEIIYVRGNHDDFLDNLAPLTFANLRIVKDYELESGGYTLLLAFNSFYNRYRVRHGKPYYSLSQHVKQKVKSAVNYISDFEHTLAEFAHARKYDGIICGHIHHPDNTEYESIHYLNSGDWVETLSALAEDEDGHWNIIFYTDIADSLPQDTPATNLLTIAS